MKKETRGMTGFFGKAIALSILLLSAVAGAQQYSQPMSPVALGSTEDCVIPRVEGERVPFPLQKANTKFELAQGETYLLNGMLVVSSGKVYLKLDFVSQPWLATDRMTAHPYLEVTSIDAATARGYANRIVQVAVVAKSMESSTNTANTRPMDLKLTSFLPPILAH
jgi:hypothetical protein